MNPKVVSLNSVRKNRKIVAKDAYATGYTLTGEVEKDISRLCKALGVNRKDAIELAEDFYKRYPMLMEHVRSPNNLLKK